MGTVPASIELKVKSAPIIDINAGVEAMLDGQSPDETFPETVPTAGKPARC